MNQCREGRRNISKGIPFSMELERHLFSCSACRRFARAEQILGLLSEFRQPLAVVPEDFVERVMSGLTTKGEPKSSFALMALRWAAAILIFSMAAGYGFSISEDNSKSMQEVASVTSVEQVTSFTTDHILTDEVESLGF